MGQEERYVQPTLFSIEPNVAAVFLVKYKDQVPYVLMGMRKDKTVPYITTPPGGKREIGETIEECAVRETLEETSLEISDEELIEAGPIMAIKNYWIQPYFYFVDADYEPENPEPEKNDYWYWISVLELFGLVESRAYPDVTSAINYIAPVLAEMAIDDGNDPSMIIPSNRLREYSLFEDIKSEYSEKQVLVNVTVQSERTGTFLDWIH